MSCRNDFNRLNIDSRLVFRDPSHDDTNYFSAAALKWFRLRVRPIGWIFFFFKLECTNVLVDTYSSTLESMCRPLDLDNVCPINMPGNGRLQMGNRACIAAASLFSIEIRPSRHQNNWYPPSNWWGLSNESMRDTRSVCKMKARWKRKKNARHRHADT